MALLPALVVMLLVESLAALTFSAATARARLVGDRRLAIEADLVLEQAIAESRVQAVGALGTMPPATTLVLPSPAITDWEVSAEAEREGNAPLVRLRVTVLRRAASGLPVAARQGTLLLAQRAADTAIVLDNRPGF